MKHSGLIRKTANRITQAQQKTPKPKDDTQIPRPGLRFAIERKQRSKTKNGTRAQTKHPEQKNTRLPRNVPFFPLLADIALRLGPDIWFAHKRIEKLSMKHSGFIRKTANRITHHNRNHQNQKMSEPQRYRPQQRKKKSRAPGDRSEEDKPEANILLESWDWGMNDQLLDGDFSQFDLRLAEATWLSQ